MRLGGVREGFLEEVVETVWGLKDINLGLSFLFFTMIVDFSVIVSSCKML